MIYTRRYELALIISSLNDAGYIRRLFPGESLFCSGGEMRGGCRCEVINPDLISYLTSKIVLFRSYKIYLVDIPHF